MVLHPVGKIELPEHVGQGGFDHAAIHAATGKLFVAHTINNSLDVIDITKDRYLHSIPDLSGVAGALVDDSKNLVFTSNRNENTVSIFHAISENNLGKIPVGVRPNGLTYDPKRQHLLAANVGDPEISGSYTVSVIDTESLRMTASIPMPGRTRWAVFDQQADAFYINIMDPAQIVVVDAKSLDRIARVIRVPAAGPHGLDLDNDRHLLYCACDAKKLVQLDPQTGQALTLIDLNGTPDVIFFNPMLKHLYAAIGDPGVIDVVDTQSMQIIKTISTEKGAHTIAFNAANNKIYVFAPQSHSALVFVDG